MVDSFPANEKEKSDLFYYFIRFKQILLTDKMNFIHSATNFQENILKTKSKSCLEPKSHNNLVIL